MLSEKLAGGAEGHVVEAVETDELNVGQRAMERGGGVMEGMGGALTAEQQERGTADGRVLGNAGGEFVHGAELALPGGDAGGQEGPAARGAHGVDARGREADEVAEAESQRVVEAGFSNSSGEGGELLAGNGSGNGQRGLVSDEAANGRAESRAEGADGAVGVTGESGAGTGGGENRGDIFVLLVNEIRSGGIRIRGMAGAAIAVAVAAAVHKEAGEAGREKLGDAEPVCADGETAVDEDDCGAGTDAGEGDAGSVRRVHGFADAFVRLVEEDCAIQKNS